MISMRIEGLDRFVKSMDERALKLVVNISRTLANEAKFIETEAKGLAPQGATGNLKELIHTTTPRVEADAVIVTVQGGTDYTPYQEFGTGQAGAASDYLPSGSYRADWPGIPATKFFRGAVEKRIDRAREAIARAAVEQ